MTGVESPCAQNHRFADGKNGTTHAMRFATVDKTPLTPVTSPIAIMKPHRVQAVNPDPLFFVIDVVDSVAGALHWHACLGWFGYIFDWLAGDCHDGLAQNNPRNNTDGHGRNDCRSASGYDNGGN